MSSSTTPLSPVAPLVARDLAKSYGERVVLDGLDVRARPGEPLGLVGENGTGKSTLLRLLAGTEEPDAGTVTRPAELVHLGQEPTFTVGATVADVLADALAPLHDAVSRLEHLAARLDDPVATEQYADLLDWAQLHAAWDADLRARLAAERLGLDAVPQDTPVAALSGGQRMRLALATVVARRPGCVLLDEPTNHLDDTGAEFLEDFLREVPGVVVLASHDRTFLDRVCGALVDLDPAHHGGSGDTGPGTRYTGGYRDYLQARHRARALWEQAFAQQQDELDRLRGAARSTARSVAPHDRPPRDNDRFIYAMKGQRVARAVGRRVRDVERRIEALEQDRVPKPPAQLALRPPGRHLGGSGGAVTVRDLVVPARLSLPHLDVRPGGRLLVTGGNGSGKSTLLKVLAGVLPGPHGRGRPGGTGSPSGTVQVHARRVGHLPQEVVFTTPERTAEQVYERATGAPVPLAHLGLLHPRDAARPVGLLSVGQQRRLALAVLLARTPDLLLLDEPTNHISPALADELAEALATGPATVVLASHDRWLRRHWQHDVLALSPPPSA